MADVDREVTPYECGICFDSYSATGMTIPVMISCGHTCCRGCLRSKACPFCRKAFAPAITSLPTNFSLIPPDASKKRKRPSDADILGGLSSYELEQLAKKKREEEGELKGLAEQREAVTKTFNALAAQMDSDKQAVQADIDKYVKMRRAKSAPKIASLQREMDEAGDSLRQLNARIGELGGEGVKEGGSSSSSSSSSSSNVARVAQEAAGELICAAAKDGNMAKLGPLVGQWRGNAAVLNWVDESGKTPLYYAACLRLNVECVRLLAATEGVLLYLK